MAVIKALFPIGKTQWAKWSDDQRTAFNEARAAGVPYGDAVVGANQTQTKKKKNVFDIIEDVAEAAAVISPAVSVVKTVVKAATKKKAK
jgi:hypothetical protein